MVTTNTGTTESATARQCTSAGDSAVELLRASKDGVLSWNVWRNTHQQPIGAIGGAAASATWAPIDLSDTDLQGLDLRGANLANVCLAGADLARANLTDATLADSDVARAQFFDSVLAGADLSRVARLAPRSLARSDISGARLPKDVGFHDAIRNLEEACKACHTLFLGLLAAGSYSALSVFTTTDAQLLLGIGDTSLPIVPIKVEIRAFYPIATWLLLLVHVYFQLSLRRLWDELSRLPAVLQDGRTSDALVHAWVLGTWPRRHIPLLRERGDRPPWGPLDVAVSGFLIWAFVPIAMGLVCWRTLVLGDVVLTMWQATAVMLALGSSVMFCASAAQALRGRPLSMSRKCAPELAKVAVLICALAVALAACGYAASPIWWMQPAVSAYGAQLPGKNLARQSGLRNAQLPSGNLKGASLVDTDLTGANLLQADLSYANLDGTILHRANLVSAQFVAADLRNTQLQDAVLRGVNFSEANLEGADLRSVDLRSAMFLDANLSGARILSAPGADLTRARLLKAELRNTNLARANLTSANMTGAKLQHATLDWANLTFANMTDAEFQRATLDWANLTGANLTRAAANKARMVGANLNGAILVKANLVDASLIKATLRAAILAEANLIFAKLGYADLAGAFLQGAKLDKADLTGADLTGAVLSEARLVKADLRMAKLIGANLAGAVLTAADLGGTQLRGACYTAGTKLPAGFNPRSRGMVHCITSGH